MLPAKQTRAKSTDAADIETAGNELVASAERFAALERRYAAHLAISTRAAGRHFERTLRRRLRSAIGGKCCAKPALLRAIVEPNIHTARADRDRAVDLRWVLRDIRNGD